MLGLLVGVALDIAAVRRDHDELPLPAVVPEPLDQLAARPGLVDREVRMRHHRIDHAVELVGGVGVLRVHLAHRVQPERVAAQPDPDLMPDRTADRSEPRRIDRAVLAAVLQVPLVRQRLPDRRVIGRHPEPPASAPSTPRAGPDMLARPREPCPPPPRTRRPLAKRQRGALPASGGARLTCRLHRRLLSTDLLLPVTPATTQQTRLLPMRDCCSTGVVSMVIA